MEIVNEGEKILEYCLPYCNVTSLGKIICINHIFHRNRRVEPLYTENKYNHLKEPLELT